MDPLVKPKDEPFHTGGGGIVGLVCFMAFLAIMLFVAAMVYISR